VRVTVDVCVHHRRDQCTGPFAALGVRAGRGAVFGDGAALLRIGVASRRACAIAVFAPVGFSFVRPVGCATFGKIIVVGKGDGGPPSPRSLPAARAQLRLRNNAGRVRERKSATLHGTDYKPATRRPG